MLSFVGRPISRHSVLLLTLILLGHFSVKQSVAAEVSPPRPNVLLIMADDLGFSDLGCYGGEIKTPNLDRLAESGLRYTNFYNTGRCWPTRGSLLTGHYAQAIRRDKIPGVPSGGGSKNRRPAWAVLLPRMLKTASYRSYHVGKWHIDGTPVAEGFDRSYWLDDQSRFFSPTRHFLNDAALPPVAEGSGFYATTELADRAIEMLRQHHAESAEQPFFQYLAFAAPHFPLHALPEDIAIYREQYQEGWDAIRTQRWRRIKSLGILDSLNQPSRVEPELGPPYHFPDVLETLGPGEVNRPVAWKSLNPAEKSFQAEKMAIHAAMVHRMDIEIGRVLDQIETMGQTENTMVIFLSDNGASAEIMVRGDGHDRSAIPGSAKTYLCLGPGWSTTCNTPFRRHKTWTHEGGISTPMIVSWPTGIKDQGAFRHSPGHVIDVTPTLTELAGVRFGPEAPKPPGRSLVATFTQDDASKSRDLWFFHDGHRAVRRGDWKAVSPLGEPWELYDLSRDRGESTDLAVAKPKLLDELTGLWTEKFEKAVRLATDEYPLEKQQQVLAASPIVPPGSHQKAGLPQRKQVLLGGTSFRVGDRHAFLMKPEREAESEGPLGMPWIFYAPTLSAYPDAAESWMHQKFLDAGVAVAGIDVGEAYGSPQALPHFDRLYDHMVANGYSKRPALLGRSRGGLWVTSWAIAHPERVAGIAGIYPVYDFKTYPGIERASVAYDLSPAELAEAESEWNPIAKASALAEARIPIHIIHGLDDKVVPIEPNSLALAKVYAKHGEAGLINVVEVPGQGHNFWPGFFQSQPLVDFLIEKAKQGR